MKKLGSKYSNMWKEDNIEIRVILLELILLKLRSWHGNPFGLSGLSHNSDKKSLLLLSSQLAWYNYKQPGLHTV